MTKTPPDETSPADTPILTRPAQEAALGAPEESREILDAIDSALEDHAEWLRKWHRAVVCGLPPVCEVVSKHAQYLGHFGSWFDMNSRRSLLDQPVFKQLWAAHVDKHRFGRMLALKAVDGQPLPARDYDTFMKKADRFSTIARRIRDAFQRAVFDLDPLTGVHNRRSMMAELDRERDRALRTGAGLCVALCDVDHFKSVNDKYGHSVGDQVLLAVVGRLIANLRPYDSIYRFGGEEFLIALPDADKGRAVGVAERLRRALCDTEVAVSEEMSLPVTASFGLCMVEEDASLDETIGRADRALYRAKHDGRNRVVSWTPDLKGVAADDA